MPWKSAAVPRLPGACKKCEKGIFFQLTAALKAERNLGVNLLHMASSSQDWKENESNQPPHQPQKR